MNSFTFITTIHSIMLNSLIIYRPILFCDLLSITFVRTISYFLTIMGHIKKPEEKKYFYVRNVAGIFRNM